MTPTESVLSASEMAAIVLKYQREGLDKELERDSTLEGVARIKLAIDQTRTALNDMDTLLADIFAEVIPPDGELIEGIGHITGTFKAQKPKFQSDRLLDVLVARARDERTADPETGEYEELAWPLLRILIDCAPLKTPSFKWKTGGLKKHGVDPKEYQTVEGWTKKIRLRPIGTPETDEDEEAA